MSPWVLMAVLIAHRRLISSSKTSYRFDKMRLCSTCAGCGSCARSRSSGSFSAAADALNFTQSAVSQQIAALEGRPAPPSSQRGAGGVRLTDAGRALVAPHRRRSSPSSPTPSASLPRSRACRAAACGSRASRAPARRSSPRPCRSTAQRHPEVELSLTEGEPHDTIPRLKRGRLRPRGRVRLHARHRRRATCSTGLDCIHLLDDPLCAVRARPGHPLARAQGDPARAARRATPWVAGCGGGICNAMLEEACAAGGLPAHRSPSRATTTTCWWGSSRRGRRDAAARARRCAPPRPGVVVRPGGGHQTRCAGSSPRRPPTRYRSPATEAMIEFSAPSASASRRPRSGRAPDLP